MCHVAQSRAILSFVNALFNSRVVSACSDTCGSTAHEREGAVSFLSAVHFEDRVQELLAAKDGSATVMVLSKTNAALVEAAVRAMDAGVRFTVPERFMALLRQCAVLGTATCAAGKGSLCAAPCLHASAVVSGDAYAEGDADSDTSWRQVARALVSNFGGGVSAFKVLVRLIGFCGVSRSGGVASEGQRTTPALHFSTVHTAKGQEADHVFVQPDVFDGQAEPWPPEDASSPTSSAAAQTQRRNVQYVAVTRARKSVTLLYRPALQPELTQLKQLLTRPTAS